MMAASVSRCAVWVVIYLNDGVPDIERRVMHAAVRIFVVPLKRARSSLYNLLFVLDSLDPPVQDGLATHYPVGHVR